MTARRPPRPWHRLYALWAWLVFFPLFLLDTLVMGVAAWWVSYFSANAATAIARLWSRIALALTFTPVTLTGGENAVPHRSYVIMANHRSLADIVALATVLPLQFRFVMKAELRRIPVFGRACAGWGCVFVARENRARAIASLQGAQPLLEGGASLVVFPEGTRSPDEQLLPFKKGGFMVALALGVPILPVTLYGSADVLPARSLALRPGRIRVVIHPAIDTASYGLPRRDELMALVRQVIAPAALPADERDSGPASADRAGE